MEPTTRFTYCARPFTRFMPTKSSTFQEHSPLSVGRPALLEGQTEAKRQQILQGAHAIFMDVGFDVASMEQIAKKAGVSKGTMYNYFANKEALFAALIESECERLRGKLFGHLNVDKAPEEFLYELGVMFLQKTLGSDELNMYRIIVAQSIRFPVLGQIFENSGPTIGGKMLGSYLRGLCDQGVLQIDDEKLAAFQFFSLCEADMLRRAQLQIEMPTKEMMESRVRSAVRVFLRGYSV
jgi:TetR/AcrR family transcriptional regulator, mexJK operon transcriptional repressor